MATMAMLFSETPYMNTWIMDVLMETPEKISSESHIVRLRFLRYCNTTDIWSSSTKNGIKLQMMNPGAR